MKTVVPFQQHNRHPVDELADVRSEIKQLETREAELRQELMADGADRVGDQYEAFTQDLRRRRLDIPALIERLGPDTVNSFYRANAVRYLRLRPVRRTTR